MKKKPIAFVVAAAVAVSAFAFTGCTKETLKGFDIDLARAVGEELGIKVEFQLINWDSKETELASKSIDLIWNGMTINDERLEKMEISTPYMDNKQVAVIRKADASKYTNVDSIKNAAVAYEKGSAGQDAAKESGITNTRELAAQVDALTEVKAKTSDVAILDSVLANYYCGADAAFSDLQVLDLGFAAEKYGIAARKGDKGTIDKINTVLAAFQKSVKLGEIADEYGLKNEICDVSYESKWGSFSADDRAGWSYIESKGKIIIGYTLYAPIAFEA